VNYLLYLPLAGERDEEWQPLPDVPNRSKGPIEIVRILHDKMDIQRHIAE
jgi:hypothetical protein